MKQEKRTLSVMTRLNQAEMDKLDAMRVPYAMTRGKYIRTRIMDEPLPRATVAPELNRMAWVDLARAASNLNQIAHHMNLAANNNQAWLEELSNVAELYRTLQAFRQSLIGAAAFMEKA